MCVCVCTLSFFLGRSLISWPELRLSDICVFRINWKDSLKQSPEMQASWPQGRCEVSQQSDGLLSTVMKITKTKRGSARRVSSNLGVIKARHWRPFLSVIWWPPSGYCSHWRSWRLSLPRRGLRRLSASKVLMSCVRKVRCGKGGELAWHQTELVIKSPRHHCSLPPPSTRWRRVNWGQHASLQDYLPNASVSGQELRK